MKFIIIIFLAFVVIFHFVKAQDSAAYAIRQTQFVDPEGSYSFEYETSNGIQAQEKGFGGVNAEGFYGYTSPEGQPVQITYIADENGYQAQGDVIPQPPPIPPLIQKALEYIASNQP